MIKDDFKYIDFFTWDEVKRTHANPKDVQFLLILGLDILRHSINSPIKIFQNGMTTGKHKSNGHPNGLAADVFCPNEKNFYRVFKASIDAGFNKIGVYYNGRSYSYHLEIADKAAFWIGTKYGIKDKWTFNKLMVDPKLIRRKA